MIRDFQVEDFDAIKSIHETQGFDYNCPELTNPLFLVKKVRVVNGRVVAAMCLRVTAETFLLIGGSPETRVRSILELQPEVLREAFDKGLSDVVCVVPPEISASFAPVLARMGWEQGREWPMWSRELSR
jgi:hypothetical protein